jgi:cytoskeleton protein RodZ
MGQPALNEDEIYYTDMPVGQILRRTREHYGQSIVDIERALRIRASQIAAIEENDMAKLPGRVYALGFVRTYSEYLGLDGNKMVHLFKAQAGGSKDDASPALHFKAPPSESKVPPVPVVAISVVVSIIILIGWWAMQGRDREIVNEVPEVPPTMQSGFETPEPEDAANYQPPFEDIPEPPASEAQDETSRISVDTASDPLNPSGAPSSARQAEQEAAQETAPPAETAEVEATPAPEQAAEPPRTAGRADNNKIILNIIQNSWVEIRDKNGATIVSRVLEAGEQYYVPDRADLTMSLGNAGGVELEIDGSKLSALGRKGDVKKNIPLDAARLKKTYSSNTGNSND